MKRIFIIGVILWMAEINYAQTFTISGAKMTTNAACYLNLNHATKWVNNNTTPNVVLNNCTVKFLGTGTQFIGGLQPTAFYNLRIAKSSGDVYLAQHELVNNQIYMESGYLDLQNFNITLSSTATLQNETMNRRIKATDGTNEGYGIGYLTTTRTDPTGNVANMGLDFTPVGGNLGVTEIRRGHLRQQGSGSFTSNYSIFRYYQLFPATMRQLSVNQFNYFVDATAELNGHTESNLVMFQEVQYWNGSSNPVYWEPEPTPVHASYYVSSSTTVNPIMLNYIKITLASSDKPLPVEMISFYGRCNHNINSIFWQTASETNNYGFFIEKSNDAENWATLQFVNGQGTVNQTTSYSVDDLSPFTTVTYYRLHQIDNNGNALYSSVISIWCSSPAYAEDILPLQGEGNAISFMIQGIPGKSYHIILTNVLGQTLSDTYITLSLPQETINISSHPYVTGIYYISMLSSEKRISKPFYYHQK